LFLSAHAGWLVKILKELNHENIVKLERVVLNPTEHEVNLVLDYADHDLAVRHFVCLCVVSTLTVGLVGSDVAGHDSRASAAKHDV
jgi:hypothetical protein